MNINDLTEQQLNTLAALGQSLPIVMKHGQPCFVEEFDPETPAWIHDVDEWKCYIRYDPCNNGSQAMDLLEKYGIQLALNEIWWWANPMGTEISVFDDTPKLAITRAFVASKYGTDIDFDAIVGGVK